MKVLENIPWVKIKKEGKNNCYGMTEIAEKKKGAKFWLARKDGCLYLRVKGDDERLLEFVSNATGKPDIKWTVGGWFGKSVMYAWGSPEKIKKLYDLLCLADATRSGLFSFLGHRDVQLLQA